ncbi:hypothetical protein [Paraburkholderia tropica]|uniref:hypothetical protein n=1 Tax=Paraburkholderia tropica TaxID=92647 RepID=UPI0016095774|nr:hypothetical protein [Paraburkholderia tropica]MBB3000244.1 hypothetical protein [Paraburkholderia tropica]MBB6319875.1 hypothetical protein [Paraburkholderia tropica]
MTAISFDTAYGVKNWPLQSLRMQSIRAIHAIADRERGHPDEIAKHRVEVVTARKRRCQRDPCVLVFVSGLVQIALGAVAAHSRLVDKESMAPDEQPCPIGKKTRWLKPAAQCAIR